MAEEEQQEQQQQENDGGKSTFRAPSSQEELDRIIESRLTRERDKYKDYEDLKTKATRLKEIEDAGKDELQKANDRIAGLETKNTALEAQIKSNDEAKQIADWKNKVAETTGFPAALLQGSTLEEITKFAEDNKELVPAKPGAAPAGKQGLDGDDSGASGDLSAKEINDRARGK